MKISVKLILFVFLSISSLFCFSQNNEKENKFDENGNVLPCFVGGNDAMMKYIKENIKNQVPTYKDREAIIVVKFTVNEDGKILEPEIVKSYHKVLDAEVLRILSDMPKWEPAYNQEGKVIKTTMSLQIKLD